MKIVKLLQLHLEGFEEISNDEYGLFELRGTNRINGATVRAAVDAGWFGDGLSVDDVGKMTPVEVRKLAEDINDAYKKATEPDPN